MLEKNFKMYRVEQAKPSTAKYNWIGSKFYSPASICMINKYISHSGVVQMEGRVVVFVFGIFDLTKMVFFSKIILRSKWKNWCRCSHSEDKRNSSKWVVLTQISETLVFKRVQLQGLTYELEINSTSVCSNYEEVCFVRLQPEK